jgi:DNA-binding SARP family transcriptional activator
MLRVRLFGRFRVQSEGVDVSGLEGARVQELFAYLLLNHGRAHVREGLAGVFWSESGSDQARKYLRQTLWHLQTALDQSGAGTSRLLEVTNDWVRLHIDAGVWLDVAELESAAATARGLSAAEMTSPEMHALRAHASVYEGDLFDGCYQDWCLLERERLQNVYLVLLDKLMAACEAHGDFEDGIELGAQMLRRDPARERTHRRLMRLQYQAGDRTAALRQYQRCVVALERELGVAPAGSTQKLNAQIRADFVSETRETPLPLAAPRAGILTHVLDRLAALQAEMVALARQVEDEVRLTEHPSP